MKDNPVVYVIFHLQEIIGVFYQREDGIRFYDEQEFDRVDMYIERWQTK